MNSEHPPHKRPGHDLQAAALIAATPASALLGPRTDSRDRPKVVTLCGSTSFWRELGEANFRETVAGHVVLAPGCDMKKAHPLWEEPAAAEELKAALDALHRWKIRACDEVLVVNTGGYIGDSTRAEIAYAHQLGRPVRYTDPVGHAVIVHRPGLDSVRLGPYEHEYRAEEIAAGLRRQMHSTAHVAGTVVETGAFRPDLDHLAPRVSTDPYALAEAMDNDPGGDGTGRNFPDRFPDRFPDLYARLCAQEPPAYAGDLWGRACSAYDYLHADPADE
ncbi:hypothetical protein [Streptomyces antarcticus]|uniref:hypothetical protein n=1 Tax=Streptomyces antarcticus TaxID=2996458 RepID=UPI002D1E36CC|nr:hypothetical protein [Streptomyces sp. H34-AA3]